MLIRYGYEITVHCEHPTAMVCLLSVSEDRKIDIRVPEKVFTTPIIATATYVDSFGNRCRRLVAPSGDLTIWGDATIEDDGKIDPADFAAAEVPVAEPMDFSATGRGGHSILATTSHGSGGSSSLEAGTRQISRSSTRSGRMSSSLFGSGHTRSSIR